MSAFRGSRMDTESIACMEYRDPPHGVGVGGSIRGRYLSARQQPDRQTQSQFKTVTLSVRPALLGKRAVV